MVINELKKIRMQIYLMNQKEFSQVLGIAEQQYCRYEKMTSQPSLEVALKISEKLSKSVNDIWQLKN